MSATEPADYRRLRPVMSDQDIGRRGDDPLVRCGPITKGGPAAIGPSQPTALSRQPAACRAGLRSPGRVRSPSHRPVAGPASGRRSDFRRLADDADRADPGWPAIGSAGRSGCATRKRACRAIVDRSRSSSSRSTEWNGSSMRLGPDAAERLVPPVGHHADPPGPRRPTTSPGSASAGSPCCSRRPTRSRRSTTSSGSGPNAIGGWRPERSPPDWRSAGRARPRAATCIRRPGSPRIDSTTIDARVLPARSDRWLGRSPRGHARRAGRSRTRRGGVGRDGARRRTVLE